MNEYLAMYLAQESGTRAREYAARQALVRAAETVRPPLRIRLGVGLIRAGRLLLRGAPGWAAEARHSS